jgi:hypothetical protein
MKDSVMRKSAINQAIDIVKRPIKDNEKIRLLSELVQVEREQVAAAWLAGNTEGWEMNTDWPEHGFSYYDNMYGTKQ